MTDLPIVLRPSEEQDSGFIYSTWLKSYRSSLWATDMSNEVYFSHHKRVVANILEDPTTTIRVLCSSSDPSQVFGYLVTSSESLAHFIYIKYSFRKMGLAKSLLAHTNLFSNTTTFVTHIPKRYKSIKDKYQMEYVPYFLNSSLGDNNE